MRAITRILGNAAVLVALAAGGTAAHAAITVSEPVFIDDDTFQLIVGLSEPFGVELDGLELTIGFDAPPLSLVSVVKQPSLPGTYESLPPFKFGSISYLTPAAVPTGSLFQLTFDVTAPLTTGASVDVTLTALPTFTDEELEPIAQTASREVMAIPEPTTYALFGAGLALVAWARRRRLAQVQA